jgi:DHA1 family multidrug resistance protein-like MFS transporter
VASLAMNFWIPFLPLYMKHLGATGDANALFWVSVATTGLGLGRLVSGPFWGILSDRLGRKLMYVRALFFATATTLIAAFATEPWHVAVAYGCQGLLSGFIPAAVALTSVTVPESRLTSSLGVVTAAQYLGNTVGPAAGSALAWAFGLRGAIVAAAVMPAIAALVVYLVVPRDEVARTARAEIDTNRANGAPWWRLLSVQFGLAIFVYFFLFAADQLIRTLTPIAIEDIEGHKATGVVGIAFTLSGVASVLGVAVVARRFVRQGRLGLAVAAGCALAGAAYVLLAFALAVPLYVTWFCVIAMVQGAVLPASNTLIAANIDRSRRGTAFGLAASAQALAFMVGPFGATAAAAISIRAGYVVLGALFVGMAMLTRLAVREPVYEASEGGAR